MRYYVTLPGGEEVAVDVTQRPGGGIEVLVEGERVAVDAVDVEGAINIVVGDKVFDLWLESDGDTVGFVGSGHRARARVESDRSRIGAVASRAVSDGIQRICAPMPGRVVRVLVATGADVEAGAPVAIVEAMKMENELSAAEHGTVLSVHVAEGATVDGGAVLVTIGPRV
jgi:biotin carboxyl carrier protein